MSHFEKPSRFFYQKSKFKNKWAFIAIMIFMLPSLLMAQSSQHISSTQTITASVVKSCHITSTQAFQFNNINPINTQAVTLNNSLSFKCTKGTSGWIGIDQGQHALSTSTCSAPQRQMVDNQNDHLNYDIFYDNQGNQVWGCDQTHGQAFQVTSSGPSSFSLNAIVSIPANQDVPMGSYADQVTVTVNF